MKITREKKNARRMFMAERAPRTITLGLGTAVRLPELRFVGFDPADLVRDFTTVARTWGTGEVIDVVSFQSTPSGPNVFRRLLADGGGK